MKDSLFVLSLVAKFHEDETLIKAVKELENLGWSDERIYKASEGIAEMIESRKHVRKVCGVPHKNPDRARRGMVAAKIHGWADLEIEKRGPGYYVVTGIKPVKDPLDKNGVSMPLQGRYRWP